MLINRPVRVKREILRKLNAITKESGAQYTPTVRTLEDFFDPQADVEICLEALGYEYAPDEETPIGHTSIDLRYQINVMVSRALANDNTPIDEVCLLVCGDIEAAIMDDITQNGDAQWTRFESVVPFDQQLEGYYLWSMTFTCRATYDIDQPFSA